MKAVIRNLPHNIAAKDLSDGLGSLRFDVISVKHMTATRRPSSDGSIIMNTPLPINIADYEKIPGNFPTANPLPHRNQVGGI
jgi:hypothetical protein